MPDRVPRSLPAKLLTEAIGAIWRAAAEPRRWAEALTSIRSLAPHSGGIVVYTPFAQGQGALWQTQDAPPGFVEEYVEKWQGKDVSLHAIARRMPVERFQFGLTDVIPAPERSEFWQSLYRARGIEDMNGLVVNGMAQGGAESVLLGIFDQEHHVELAANRDRVLAALQEHLHGAVTLHWRLVHAEGSARISQSVLDRVALGVILLSATGKVLYMNTTARRIVDRGDALRLQETKLSLRDMRNQACLEKAIAAVAAGSTEKPFLIPRASGGAITGIVAPVEAGIHLGDIGKAGAILFLSDPSELAASAAARLIDLYGLTRSEAEIAQAIAEGQDSNDIATRRGVSVNTVRSQTKAIMGKLGASRQSEIVRAVLATAVLEGRG